MENSKNKTELRHERILQMLSEGETVNTAAFCGKLGCSESTIRNDLTALESMGKLRRVFGGAIRMYPPHNFMLDAREKAYLAEKEAIARYVIANFVTPNAIIILGASTTTEIIAKKLAETDIPLVVLTNYLPIAAIFSEVPHVKLYLFGGYFDRESRYFHDSYFRDNIAYLRADLMFLGIDAIHSDGFATTRRDEAFIKTALIKIAKKTIAVADHSKFAQSAMNLIDDFTLIKTLVTDAGADVPSVANLRKLGVDVRIAD